MVHIDVKKKTTDTPSVAKWGEKKANQKYLFVLVEMEVSGKPL